MAASTGKKKTANNQEKTYTFTFTVPEMIGLCAGSVAALCAFFILGILLGRGYQPENDVPELAMMMPGQSANSSGEIKGGVLKPEELSYIDQLKKKPESAVRQEPAEEKQSATPKAAAAKPADKPAPKAEAPAQPAAVAQTPPAAQAQPEPPVEMDNPQATTLPTYNYIYQAASFGDEIRARDFSDKLIANGLDAYVEPGKSGTRTWYRVFVRHTGTPESTDAMKSVLRKFGIKKPLLKSKVAAS
ncbi:SPOR domain-containing protein [Maridesulfovibrio sp.]|uniref:SPOR domain-containing protein n=1 Tax=Maridesulfovibrio sp. TaxID=2795000 RepID=UPI002A18AC20|nr:SPOR domain-containing protein [Maridesulfovibrio sp.]